MTTRVITKTISPPTTKIRTPNTFQGVSRKMNDRQDTKSMREQLVNTYLTFTYELRNNMPRNIFYKYVILILYSIENIIGISEKDRVFYEKYYEMAKDLRGTIDINIQQDWAGKIESIINDIKNIKQSKLVSLKNSIIKNVQ